MLLVCTDNREFTAAVATPEKLVFSGYNLGKFAARLRLRGATDRHV